ncbi:MAG: glyoxalase/bleomycin resistance/dioxygenase family protein [Bdellovibrionota bacterium]
MKGSAHYETIPYTRRRAGFGEVSPILLALFGQEPTKLKPDYAKWLLDDPRLNFAISTRSGETGVDHLGVQVESSTEPTEITERLKNAEIKVFDEGETTCCYSRSEKTWSSDPAGIPWEAYQNTDSDCCSPSGEQLSCCG